MVVGGWGWGGAGGTEVCVFRCVCGGEGLCGAGAGETVVVSGGTNSSGPSVCGLQTQCSAHNGPRTMQLNMQVRLINNAPASSTASAWRVCAVIVVLMWCCCYQVCCVWVGRQGDGGWRGVGGGDAGAGETVLVVCWCTVNGSCRGSAPSVYEWRNKHTRWRLTPAAEHAEAARGPPSLPPRAGPTRKITTHHPNIQANCAVPRCGRQRVRVWHT